MSTLPEYLRDPYKELEKVLDEKGIVLFKQDPGIGKTWCCNEYLRSHNYRAIVIIPEEGSSPSWVKYLNDIVTIVKYQGFCKHTERYYDLDFDVVIFDEAHHTNGNFWNIKIVDFIEKYRGIKKFIGLTATPITADGTDVAKEYFDGNIVEGRTDAWMVRHGYFKKINLIQAVFDYGPGIQKYLSTYTSFGSTNTLIQDILPIPYIISKYIVMKDHKGIIYVSGIKQVEGVIELFKDLIPRDMIRPIHSGLSKKTYEENYNWFINCKKGYAIAINTFNEGGHLDGLDVEIQLRKTESERIFVQQVGRLRNKNVDCPWLFDFAGNTASVKTRKEKISYINSFNGKKVVYLPDNNHVREYNYKISDQRIIRENLTTLEEARELVESVDIYKVKFTKDDKKFILKNRWKLSITDLVNSCKNKYTVDEIQSLINRTNDREARCFRWCYGSLELLRLWYPEEGAVCYKRISGTNPYIVKWKAYQLHIIGPEEFSLDYIEQ